MDILLIPHSIVAFLCVKTILDHLEYGVQGWHYDTTGYYDRILPQKWCVQILRRRKRNNRKRGYGLLSHLFTFTKRNEGGK